MFFSWIWKKSPWCQLKTTQSSTCASSAMEPKQTMSNRAFLKHNTKLPNRCLSSSEMVSLCSVAASDFPYALLFDIASSKRLLTFNPLSELVLQAANARFLCVAVRADVLLEVEKYLPSSSSDNAVKLSQNFCRKSTNGDDVAHAFLQQKRLSDTPTPPKVFEGTAASITWKRLFHAHFKSRNQWPRKTSLASWTALQVELISPRKRQQRLSQRRDKNFWRTTSVQWAFYLPSTSAAAEGQSFSSACDEWLIGCEKYKRITYLGLGFIRNCTSHKTLA